MRRFFNTTGPCDPERHYMLPPESRLPDLLPLVERAQYFVIHAARQTGKTTAMRALAARLRGKGMVALHTTLEASQEEADVAAAEARWISAIAWSAAHLPPGDRPPAPPGAAPGTRLAAWFQAWASAVAPRSLVLFLDEADVVTGVPMVNLLRQLRSGFPDRPGGFPASVALVGMRDLRDYLTASKDGVPVNPGSPFNIKSESITLRNFTEAEVGELYAQHTADTGQPFAPAAVARGFYWTQGQPFLVNKLAATCVDVLATDRSVVIEAGHIDEAKERLVLSRTTHLDALAQRLREPRVARVVQAVLLGDEAIDYGHDDFQYTIDLGLLRRARAGAEPANPIYREVLAREVSYNMQENAPLPWWPWERAPGKLDFPALVAAFREWWRDNGEFLGETVPGYPEAVAHVAVMGFLQRVVNGGGRVEREFAAGRGAVDLVVHFGGERFVVEIKRVRAGRDSLERIREKGLTQIGRYLASLGETEGWLFIFDQRPGRTWDQRMWTETVVSEGRTMHLVGG
ncbi:MAG: ATP-binding protein [Deltaproteobacteria bacterium]|nr:ATP-binding protein [Deltaproteobacteria bacterium]